MRDIRLLALDLDGTLTNSQKQVSQRNREYIRLAQDRGVRVILASGRPVLGIRAVADALDLWERGGYILAYNGGHIIDCKTGTDLVKHTIPMDLVHDICEVAHQGLGVWPLCYNGTGVICENDTDPYVLKEGYNNSIPVIRVNSLEACITEPVVKFMIVGEPDALQKAYELLKPTMLGKLNLFFSEPYFMEVTPPGIEKASALAALSQLLGTDREQLMACGDGLNDIPMLQYAGLSVAMANAYPETKDTADFIVSSNEEDGVAEAIERFILSK